MCSCISRRMNPLPASKPASGTVVRLLLAQLPLRYWEELGGDAPEGDRPVRLEELS